MLVSLQAFLQAVNKMLSAYETRIKHESNLEVVKDKRSLKRASNITEEILEVVEKYKQNFDKQDLKRYEKLRRKFLRYN